MERSIRDPKAHFAEAANAAARGERVVVTKHRQPFVELIAAQPSSGMDFVKAEIVRKELGLTDTNFNLGPGFDDTAFSRHVLGLPD